MKQPFELSKEKKEQLILSIKQYYLKERGEELGNLEAGFILDFIMKEIYFLQPWSRRCPPLFIREIRRYI